MGGNNSCLPVSRSPLFRGFWALNFPPKIRETGGSDCITIFHMCAHVCSWMDRRMWWVGNGRHCLNLRAGTYAATSWYQAWCVSVVLSVLVAGAKHFAWWVARFYNFVRAHTAIWLPLAVPILSLPSTKVKRDIGARNARTFTWKIAYFCWLYIWSIIICQLLFFHWVLNLSLVLIYFKVLNAWLILFLQDL